MLSGLPESIYPYKLAAAGAQLAGGVDYDRFTRLRQHSERGEIFCDLDFFENEEGRACIAGQVEARLEVVCQRCLEPMSQHLACEVRLIVVNSGEARELGTDPELAYRDEFVLADDEPISLIALVEDELLLSLPLTPMHPQGECQIEREHKVPRDSPPEQASPFAVLSGLKLRS
jgi:uncharacterized protein